MAGLRTGLVWEMQGHLLNEENQQEKGVGQRKDGKLLEYWRISYNEDTETLCHLAKQFSQRGGKGSGIKHVGWALQCGMDIAYCHTSESWTYFSPSNEDGFLLSGDFLRQTDLEPHLREKEIRKTVLFLECSRSQITFYLWMTKGKTPISLYQRSVRFTIQITPGLDPGWLTLSKT